MRLVEKLAGNTFFLTLDWLAVTVLSFIFWIIIWKTLPPDSAGIIATSLNIIILLSTLGVFGMHATLSKLIAEYSKKNQKARIGALIKFSNRFLISINFVIALVFFLAVSYGGIDINLPTAAIVAVSVGIFVWPITHSTTSILYGFQNMKRIFTTNLFSNILKVAVVLVTIYLGFEIVGPLAALLISFASLIVFRYDVLRIGRAVKHKIDKHHVLVKYAFPSLLASLSWALFVNTPTIILTLIDSLRSSGLFAASVSMVNPLAFVPAIVSQALFPITSSLMVIKNHAKRQGDLIRLVIRYVLFISVPLYILYVFFAKGLVLVFAQLEYLQAVDLIPFIGFAVLVQGLGHIFLSSLFAIRRTELNRNVTIVTAVSFLGLSVPMTILFGLTGMVLAFVLSAVIFASVGYVLLRRSLKFSIPWTSIGKIFASSAPMIMLLVITNFGIDYGILPEILESKLVTLLPVAVVGMYLYFLTLKKMKFYDKDDSTIIQFAKNKVKFLSPFLESFEKFMRN